MVSGFLNVTFFSMACVFSVLDLRAGGGEISRARVMGVASGILRSTGTCAHASGYFRCSNAMIIGRILFSVVLIDVL